MEETKITGTIMKTWSSHMRANFEEGVDYHHLVQETPACAAVIAPHGGGVEPGTSEVTRAAAAKVFSFYIFEAVRKAGNDLLHVSSIRYDNHVCRELIKDKQIVMAVHGCSGSKPRIYVGGKDSRKTGLLSLLEMEGFPAYQANMQGLRGTHAANICNMGASRSGIQLELSEGFRKTLFKGLSRDERQCLTDHFYRFTNLLHTFLVDQTGEM